MSSKEALDYIKNHGAWKLAAIHGMTEVDEKLVESFDKIDKDLCILVLLKYYWEHLDKIRRAATYEDYYASFGTGPCVYALPVEVYKVLKEWLKQCT